MSASKSFLPIDFNVKTSDGAIWVFLMADADVDIQTAGWPIKWQYILKKKFFCT